MKTELSEQDYNEQLRRKWEKEKYENIEKMNIRYEDIRYDGIFIFETKKIYINKSFWLQIKTKLEIRNLGVGNFRFSKDETERQKQMEFLQNLHLEVNYVYNWFDINTY